MNYLISIDGSTTKTGVSIFNLDNEELVEYKAICPENPYKTTKKGLSKEDKKRYKKLNMDYRIEYMMKEIRKLLTEYKPIEIYIEDTYGGKDMYAYKKLCHLQGLLLSYAIDNEIVIKFKPPQLWRSEIGIPIIEDKVRLKRDDFKDKAIEFVYDKYGITVSDDEAESICLGISRFVK